MSEFDPYHKWLGIPETARPVSKYRLLGIDDFEDDSDVITAASDRQAIYLRTLQAGEHAALVAEMLNEVSQARVTLLNADQKAAYDEQLRKHQTSGLEPAPAPTPILQTPPPLPGVPSSTLVDDSQPVTQPIAGSVVQSTDKPHRSEPREVWKGPAVIGILSLALLLLVLCGGGVFVYFQFQGPAAPNADTVIARREAEDQAAEEARKEAADKRAEERAAAKAAEEAAAKKAKDDAEERKRRRKLADEEKAAEDEAKQKAAEAAALKAAEEAAMKKAAKEAAMKKAAEEEAAMKKAADEAAAKKAKEEARKEAAYKNLFLLKWLYETNLMETGFDKGFSSAKLFTNDRRKDFPGEIREYIESAKFESTFKTVLKQIGMMNTALEDGYLINANSEWRGHWSWLNGNRALAKKFTTGANGAYLIVTQPVIGKTIGEPMFEKQYREILVKIKKTQAAYLEASLQYIKVQATSPTNLQAALAQKIEELMALNTMRHQLQAKLGLDKELRAVEQQWGQAWMTEYQRLYINLLRKNIKKAVSGV
jgi:hypothetical protein